MVYSCRVVVCSCGYICRSTFTTCFFHQRRIITFIGAEAEEKLSSVLNRYRHDELLRSLTRREKSRTQAHDSSVCVCVYVFFSLPKILLVNWRRSGGGRGELLLTVWIRRFARHTLAFIGNKRRIVKRVEVIATSHCGGGRC